MKVVAVDRPWVKFTIDVSEREIELLQSAVKLLMDRYPNSDPIIDLHFDLRKVMERR